MRDAVLLRALRGRNLEVGVLRELAILADDERGVAAHLQRMHRLTVGRGAAAPLVGEDDLRAVVREHGRVPQREVGVGDGIEPHRALGITDVDEQAVAAAGTGEQADRGIRRHVVAVARPGGHHFRHHRAVGTGDGTGGTRPAAARRRRSEAGEDAGAGHDFGVGRPVERHLDDVEAIQRVRLVRRIRAVLAPRQLGGGASPLLTRDIDVDHARILRVRNHRVRMRTLAGLDVLHEPRGPRIRDIVDAHAGHMLRRILHAALRAVLAVAAAFGRDEEEIADDRGIALRCDAGKHREQRRGLGIADVVDREAGEVADVHQVAFERDIGVDERQPFDRIEGFRLGRRREQRHPLDRDPGVAESGLEVVARIISAGVGLRADDRRKRQRPEQVARQRAVTEKRHTEGLHGKGHRSSSICRIRPISAVCVVSTSLANTLMSTSCAARGVAIRSATISRAP